MYEELSTPFPEYRFRKSISDFKISVDIASELIEKKDLFILFGAQGHYVSFELILTEDQFEERNLSITHHDFNEILADEIIPLIEQYLAERDDYDGLESWLKKNDKLNDDDVARYVRGHKEKIEYLCEKIITENNKKQFDFKRLSNDNKIAGIDSNIYKYVLNSGNEVPFVQIQLDTTKKIVPTVLYDEHIQILINAETTSFICDINDLECLICLLNDIKEKLVGM